MITTMRKHKRAASTPYSFSCLLCHRKVDLRDYTSTGYLISEMATKQLCHECAYWETLLDDGNPDIQIIDGECFGCIDRKAYKVHPEYQLLKTDLGHRYILTTDMKPRDVIVVKLYGTLPSAVREKHPDTSIEIPRHIYYMVKKRTGFKCLKKGCYDRYSCLWYVAELAEPDGPWNVIPEWHTPGWENCPSYINKSTIYDNSNFDSTAGGPRDRQGSEPSSAD